MTHGGYWGKNLFVDLSRGTVETRPLDWKLAELFVGGPALGARMLWDLMEPGVDPLGPESWLAFLPGPLTGTGTPFAGRYTAVCKSPVTGGFNDSNSGGFFGPELKKTGFDGLYITGRAEHPVYLLITDDCCEIRKADDLWGLDYMETEARLDTLLSEERGLTHVRYAGVGQAGENRSLISCIMNDGHRAAGRGGAGAVMGSKNLKIIAARGTKKAPVADPDRFLKTNRQILENVRTNPGTKPYRAYGTGLSTTSNIFINDAGVKNWGGVGSELYTQEEAEALGAPELDRRYRTGGYACSYCPVGCGALYSMDKGKYPIGHTTRPEYETAATFGSMLLNKNTDVLVYCNDLCNRYGLDTISAGAVIAWVMECYEHNLLTSDDLDGLHAEWGNEEAIVSLTHKMGRCEGCGKILAQGSARAADIWGRGHEYLMVAMGIEPGQHDSRLMPGLARTFQFDPTPGRHVKGGFGFARGASVPPEERYVFENTGDFDVACMSGTEFNNATGYCMFNRYGVTPELANAVYESVTGFPMDDAVKLSFGRRSFSIRFAFNIREGIKKSDYTISPRLIGEPPLKSGPTGGRTIDAKKLADNFFTSMGWDAETATPKKESLRALGGLDDVAEVVGL